ncbi:MAG: hypothetical protein IJK89_00945 [Clostridia bacterium]|nr:hypothetical protein [Clostridia bacterium]
MSDFITVPNLPEAPVTLAAVCDDTPVTEALHTLGVNTVSPAPSPVLPTETARHADMLLCHAGGNVCFVSPEQTALAARLRQEGFAVRFSAPPGAAYPDDIKLNAAVGKDFALGLIDRIDAGLAAYLREKGRVLAPVKQGYAKCGLCFVTENAFITEDPSIADALERRGAAVLRIAPGDVYLSEAHHGFFGGAGGKIAPDRLAVTGRLSFHRDGDAIRRFAAEHGVEIVELTDERIMDIGGILPLKNRDLSR